jgi:hypothetical protein
MEHPGVVMYWCFPMSREERGVEGVRDMGKELTQKWMGHQTPSASLFKSCPTPFISELTCFLKIQILNFITRSKAI